MARGKRLARSRSAADSSWTGMPISLRKETVVLPHTYRGRKQLRLLHVYCRDCNKNRVSSTAQVYDDNDSLPAGVERLPGREAPTARDPGVCTARQTRD